MDTVGRIVDLVGGSREPSKSLSGVARQVMPMQEFQAVQAACENLRAENARLRAAVEAKADEFERLAGDHTKTSAVQNMWKIVAESVRAINQQGTIAEKP